MFDSQFPVIVTVKLKKKDSREIDNGQEYQNIENHTNLKTFAYQRAKYWCSSNQIIIIMYKNKRMKNLAGKRNLHGQRNKSRI